MTTILDIVSDRVVTMTKVWHRSFVAAGCHPTCHGCLEDLPVGSKFKLATVKVAVLDAYSATTESKEVMLCAKCTPAKVSRKEGDKKRKFQRYKIAHPGCYRINGKIVP